MKGSWINAACIAASFIGFIVLYLTFIYWRRVRRNRVTSTTASQPVTTGQDDKAKAKKEFWVSRSFKWMKANKMDPAKIITFVISLILTLVIVRLLFNDGQNDLWPRLWGSGYFGSSLFWSFSLILFTFCLLFGSSSAGRVILIILFLAIIVNAIPRMAVKLGYEPNAASPAQIPLSSQLPPARSLPPVPAHGRMSVVAEPGDPDDPDGWTDPIRIPTATWQLRPDGDVWMKGEDGQAILDGPGRRTTTHLQAGEKIWFKGKSRRVVVAIKY